MRYMVNKHDYINKLCVIRKKNPEFKRIEDKLNILRLNYE